MAGSIRREKKKTAFELLLSGRKQNFFGLLLWQLVISKYFETFHFSALK